MEPFPWGASTGLWPSPAQHYAAFLDNITTDPTAALAHAVAGLLRLQLQD